jgi:hypothetical protein
MRISWAARGRLKGFDVVIIAAAAALVGGALMLPTSTGGVPGASATQTVPDRGTPTPIPAPPPAVVVSGWSVDMIGDSLTVGAILQLKAALPGIYLYARVGKQFSYGLSIVAALKAQKMLRHIVIVDLGTNGPVQPGDLSKLVNEVGPNRGLVLVNTFEPQPWEHEVNAALAAAARSYPNVVLANWYDAIRHRTYLLSADGFHPGPAGTLLWVRVVKAAVYRAASLVG